MSHGWDAISLDCHWRPREETPEQLARRLKELLCNLEALHPVFRQLQLYSRPTDQWEFPLGDSHTDASVLAQKFKKVVKRDTGDPFPFYCGTRMTFLADRYLNDVVPPPDIAVEVAGDGGRLFVAMSEAFDRDSHGHVDAAKKLHTALAPLDGLLSRWG